MMKLREIVEQLRSCGYTCEAGALENNVAFMELERITQANESVDALLIGYEERLAGYHEDVRTLIEEIRANQKQRQIEKDAKEFAADVKAGRIKW